MQAVTGVRHTLHVGANIRIIGKGNSVGRHRHVQAVLGAVIQPLCQLHLAVIAAAFAIQATVTATLARQRGDRAVI